MKKLFFSTLIAAGILSCHKSGEHQTGNTPLSEHLLETLIPASRLPLYADLSSYDLSSGYRIRTKSAMDDENTVTLYSQLDFSETREMEFKGVHYTQVPFFDNDSPEKLTILYDNESEITSDKLAPVRKYYVETVRSEGTQSFVVTMIPTRVSFEQDPDYDYLQKPNYSGLILFSSVKGKLLDTRAYAGGRIMRAKLVPREEYGLDNTTIVHFCSFLESGHSTKSDSEPEFITHWNGMAAICIAYVIAPSYCNGDYSGWGNAGGEWNPYSPGFGAYDSSNPFLDHGVETPSDEEEPFPDEVCFTVSVTCNIPNYIEMIGSGEYSPGAVVTIGYSYHHQASSYNFKWWVGGFSGIVAPVFLYRADRDIESTAYFDDGTIYPCSDTTRFVTNPLVNMSIAASNAYGNYRGGTYGDTRTDKRGNIKRHDGLDLAASPGTPVFAMFTGTVTNLFTNAPNYYVERSFGNTIEITSTVRNPSTGSYETVQVLYAHLQYGTPVATNYRTGMNYKYGDSVYQGELIGYSGATGNAYNVPNKHLHLGIKVDGSWVDPAPYINGTFNVDNLSVNAGRIDISRCDTGSSPLVEEDAGEEE